MNKTIPFFRLICFFLASCSSEPISKDKIDISRENSIKYNYEIIGTSHNKVVQNFYIVLKTDNYSETNLKSILKTIKSEVCNRACNLVAYDDKQYFALENEYIEKRELLGNKLANGTIDKQKWKNESTKLDKEYYLVLAEHLIGYIEFENEETFSYYPYKDSRYKELGGKNPK